MVLSLSPGPARLKEAWQYETYADIWRITDDFWDLLKQMFERCEHWQNHVGQGNYPDCDMLPVGILGKGFGQERLTRFTRNEQITMMSLWCIFPCLFHIFKKIGQGGMSNETDRCWQPADEG